MVKIPKITLRLHRRCKSLYYNNQCLLLRQTSGKARISTVTAGWNTTS